MKRGCRCNVDGIVGMVLLPWVIVPPLFILYVILAALCGG